MRTRRSWHAPAIFLYTGKAKCYDAGFEMRDRQFDPWVVDERAVAESVLQKSNIFGRCNRTCPAVGKAQTHGRRPGVLRKVHADFGDRLLA
jgi:hypothetical protein